MELIATNDAWNFGVQVRSRTFMLDDGSEFTRRQMINERPHLPGEPEWQPWEIPIGRETRQQRRYRQRKGER